MIHLDTNLLIGAEDPTDPHHQTSRRVLAHPDALACSAVVWMEFLSVPGVSATLQAALERDKNRLRLVATASMGIRHAVLVFTLREG
jgi:predicted nucleic acid-binding protein